MATSTSKSYYWKGFRDGAPFVIPIIPFGTLFGVLAVETGADALQALVFSATVFAGGAQFAALQLMQDGAPILIVLASSLAVNLRLVMYSASLTPFLGSAPMWQRAIAAFVIVDQTYAGAIVRFENEPSLLVSQRMSYFFGLISPLTPFWLLCTYLGAVLGARIPDSWALDFALPILFLALIGPMMRTNAHVVAALVATAVALLTVNVPFNLGLLIAGFAGMMAGAQAELISERERA